MNHSLFGLYFPFLCAYKQYIEKHKTKYSVPRDTKHNTYLSKMYAFPAGFRINPEQKEKLSKIFTEWHFSLVTEFSGKVHC